MIRSIAIASIVLASTTAWSNWNDPAPRGWENSKLDTLDILVNNVSREAGEPTIGRLMCNEIDDERMCVYSAVGETLITASYRNKKPHLISIVGPDLDDFTASLRILISATDPSVSGLIPRFAEQAYTNKTSTDSYDSNTMNYEWISSSSCCQMYISTL